MTARMFISAALLSLILAVSLPGYLYISNAESIDLPAANALVLAFVGFLACFALFTAIGFVLRREWYATALCAVSIFLLIKLYLLPSDVPILDGEAPFAAWNSTAGLISIASLLLIPIAYFLARRMRASAIAFLALFAVAMAAQPVFTAQKPYDIRAFSGAENSAFEFSSGKNVIIVLLDATMGDMFAQTIASRSDIRDELTGFTFFPNTVSSAPTTLLNMHSIVSGRFYEGGSIRDHYIRAADDGVFSDARAAGYRSFHGGFTPFKCAADVCAQMDGMIGTNPLQSSISQYIQLIEYSTLRVVPTAIQPWLYNGGSGRFASVSGEPVSTVDKSIAMMRSGAEGLKATDGAPKFSFLHQFISHPPISVDAACRPVTSDKVTREAYRQQTECNLSLTANLLASLKRRGLYDEATIVLVADHGFVTEDDATPDVVFDRVRKVSGASQRFNPLFAVKPANAVGPLNINYAPASNSDLRATLCALVFSCQAPGANVFELSNAPRERRFLQFGFNMSQLLSWDELPSRGSSLHVISGGVEELPSTLSRPIAR